MVKKRGGKAGVAKGWPSCTGPLDDKGFCTRRGGFPLTMACPFVCPFCRQGLTWDGGCNWCHGTYNMDDRESWTFPGDQYDAVGGHWLRIGKAQEVCTPQQNEACIAVVLDVLNRRISELAGQERIKEILHPLVPF